MTNEAEMKAETDVVIVGASVAGCAAAALFAREGLRVLLVDRVKSPDAYKRQCTHFLQSGATPVLERLGVINELEDAGAVRNGLQLWTAKAGWTRLALDTERSASGQRNHGYTLRRLKLDPILRANAARTAGVTLRLGHAIEELIYDGARVVGARIVGSEGRLEVRAKLVVGADGRHTTVAELAGIRPAVTPHHRGGFSAYYRGVKVATGTDAQFWVLGEDVAYAFPSDDGLVCLAVIVDQKRIPEFRNDREGYLRRFYARLADAPDLSEAERVGHFVGVMNTPNTYRRPDHPGLALIGDAAMASDYIWGVGCGFALQGAAFLVDATAKALKEEHGVDAGLRRFAKQHRQTLYTQHELNCRFSASATLPPLLEAAITGAAHDPVLRRLLALAQAGRISQRDLRVPLRIAWRALTQPFRGTPPPAKVQYVRTGSGAPARVTVPEGQDEPRSAAAVPI